VIPEPASLVLFAVAALALLLVPGPAVIYVVARSIQQGRRAGLASVLGIHVGTLVHIAAAAVGLSALIVSSAMAFTVVKIAGAVYLVGLGLSGPSCRARRRPGWRSERSAISDARSRRESSSTC
jgi:threonine/homoserine/homoserine lactone efflux protein